MATQQERGASELSISERLANWFGIKNKRAEQLEVQLAEKEDAIGQQIAELHAKDKSIAAVTKERDTLQKQVDSYEKEIRAINTAIEDDRQKETARKSKRGRKK